MRFNNGIIDVHVHAHGGCTVDGFIRNAVDHLSASGLDAENLLCVKHGRSACITEPNALLVKAMFPGKFNVLGNPTFIIPEFGTSREGFAEQVQDFIDAGIDGVKMADMNAAGRALDDPDFDPMFDVLEKNKAPMIYHVGGFAYTQVRRRFIKNHFQVENPPFLTYQGPQDDDTIERLDEALVEVNKVKRAQIDKLLDRHPTVKLILPHTFCHTEDLDDLSLFLDKHPSISIDLTPCDEIYFYFSQNSKRSRDFICDYRKRILFGTDNTIEMDPLNTIILIRSFLETDEKFFSAGWGFDLQGIALPKDVLEDIYRNNYRSIFNNERVNTTRAAEYCEKVYDILKKLDEMPVENKLEALECAKRLRTMK